VSATRSAVRQNIRFLLNDLNPQSYAWDSDVVDQKILDAMHEIASEVGNAQEWDEDWVTVSASDYDYTLDSAVEHQRIIALRSNLDGRLLQKVPPETLQRMRAGTPAPSGRPTHFAIHEEPDQTCILWLSHDPVEADTLDALHTQIPDTLDDDADTIPFVAPVLRALEAMVAARLLKSATPDVLEHLKLDKGDAKDMEKRAARAVRREKVRRGGFRRSSLVSEMVVPS
jgi:hypothetical protein